MNITKTVALLIVLLLAAGCVEQDRYPVMGEECSPDDLVQGLDQSDCVPPIGI